MRSSCPTIGVYLLASLITVLFGCSGGGDGDSSTPGQTTTISGRITFDRVPITDAGLNFNAIAEAPARQVVVEAIQSNNAVILASTTTNTTGDYSLTVPVNTTLFIRAKAQMLSSGSTPSWNFRVLNNTNGNALYALDGTASSSGTGASTRNLRAPSGWGGSAYTGERVAAPFAILDTIYRAKELLLSAQSTLALPALDVFWSTSNRDSQGEFCPAQGRIGTTSYVVAGGATDDCTPRAAISDGIYVLGSLSGNDTDEFDQHVIAHEYGHYVESKFSRSDSIGGPHGSGDRLDPRLAFGEGWGNAFAAMVLNDPVYKDSFVSVEPGGFNIDNNNSDVSGWFSEASVGQILWDVFDSGTESGDTVALGFTPIFATMAGVQRNTDALTTIYTFTQGLRAQSDSTVAASISSLETAELIDGRGEFVELSPEAENGGDPSALPLYEDIALNAPLSVCTRAIAGRGNKLNNRRFLRLSLAAPRTIVVNAQAAVDPAMAGSAAATDPDIYVWRRGALVAAGFEERTSTQSTNAAPLAAGVYVIEVLDFAYGGDPSAAVGIQPHCMSVNVTG
jgi:hypothetical protein